MTQRTEAEAPVRVVKIAGLGRSGSTILDVVLGNHPQVESVGEVGSIFRTGWISRESLRGIDPSRLRRPICTCGKRLDVPHVGAAEEACPFWSGVRREWVGRAGADGIEGYPKLQDDFELWRRWPRLLRERRRPSAAFRSYARLTRAFFESVRAASGKPVIVDSSTVPVQAFALGMVPGIDLYVVHLVRDGRGVVTSDMKSLKRDPRAGPARGRGGRSGSKTAARRTALFALSVARWIVRNLAAEWVCGQLGPGRAVRVRYEDFVADPGAALGRVGDLIGLDMSAVAEAAASGEPMRAGHNVGGNRTKKSGTVVLRPDDREWRSALTPAERRLSWALMGWLMRRYGYER